MFVLILLFVAAGFAIYQWGGDVLLEQAVPKGHFQAAKAGIGPDYANSASWIAKPGLANDPSHWLPEGVTATGSGNAAVFYVHPTTYLDRDRWNAPLADVGDTAFRTKLFVQSQASTFNGVGQIWAPRYRQAAYGAFLLKSEDAQKALDLSYEDVAAAFDQFVKEAGDKPIILAGHSQGALHLERLLEEKIAGKPLARRIVAAYVVGWPISVTADLPRLGMAACTAPNQTGCILSWMSFAEPANPDLILKQWEDSKGPTGADRRQQDVLCVNPVSGTKDGVAKPADNPGTLIPSLNLVSASLQQGTVGAHCDKGLLILDGAIPPLGQFVLPGNNYHVYDYALFWGAIRADAERRLAAWHR